MKYLDLANLLASGAGDWWWLFVILGIFGVIVIVIILVKRHVKIFQNQEAPKSDKEIAQEELDRLLEPVEELEPKEEEQDKQ